METNFRPRRDPSFEVTSFTAQDPDAGECYLVVRMQSSPERVPLSPRDILTVELSVSQARQLKEQLSGWKDLID